MQDTVSGVYVIVVVYKLCLYLVLALPKAGSVVSAWERI